LHGLWFFSTTKKFDERPAKVDLNTDVCKPLLMAISIPEVAYAFEIVPKDMGFGVGEFE